MIPAVLSAVYVYFLYRKLNAPASGTTSGTTSGTASATVKEASSAGTVAPHDPSAEELSQRLSDLQQRVERLTAARTGEAS